MINSTSKFSSSYHPQSNGLVERTNRSVLNILKTFISSTQSQWHKYLPSAVHQLNVTQQATIGRSSFEMLFGRQARTVDSREFATDVTELPKTLKEQLADIIKQQEHAFDMAQKNALHAMKNMKYYYDKRSNNIRPQEGDIVFLRVPRLALPDDKLKLSAKYHGPYWVVRYKSHTTVKLKDPSTGTFLKRFYNICRLKIVTPFKDCQLDSEKYQELVPNYEISENSDLEDEPPHPDADCEEQDKDGDESDQEGDEAETVYDSFYPEGQVQEPSIVTSEVDLTPRALIEGNPEIITFAESAFSPDNELRLLAKFSNGKHKWLNLEQLNIPAQQMYYSLNMKPHKVKYNLRNRLVNERDSEN